MFRFSPNPNRAHLINWREWGPDAFEEARLQEKLVMLYLGAFWCGFCQRMDETTLSVDETHTLLNAYFIPIRVEDAQRPDLNVRYSDPAMPSGRDSVPANSICRAMRASRRAAERGR